MLNDLARHRAAIDRKIRAANRQYPSLWRKITRDWRADDPQDALWLTYSANYLLRTGGVRWALDPFSLLTRTGSGGQPDFARDLAGLQLVVLSHAHADHFDPTLIADIAGLQLIWVVPEFMLERTLQAAALPTDRIRVPRVGEPICIAGLTLTPFEGLHLHSDGGLPEMGYLAEFAGKRWLFPGDTRVYDRQGLPHFGGLDGVLAHLWLGKAAALQKDPPQLENFSRFYTALEARRIVVTHLEELGREPEDFWTRRHYRLASSRLSTIAPDVQISPALTGQRLNL